MLLIAGALGGSGFGGTAEPAASPEPALEPAAATGPVLAESESFSGTLQGAALPLVGGAGAATATHALKLPDGVAAYHEELTWTPGPGGATTLSLTLEAEVDGAWQQVATATGGSPLALDAEELPADATAFRTTVALPANSGSTPVSYDLVVDSYTA